MDAPSEVHDIQLFHINEVKFQYENFVLMGFDYMVQ